jgi:hypothetical protein
MARPAGTPNKMPTKRESTDAADVAQRRAYEEIVGNTDIPDAVRDLVADIFDPVRVLLRRAGLRPIRPPAA